MKRFMWALSLLFPLLAIPAAAEQQPAEHCAAMLPFGQPASTAAVTALCRRGYAAGHDDARRGPMWVAERLSERSAWGCGSRIDGFRPDPDLRARQRSELRDYARSGFDIGHMASSANHLGDDARQRETFFLSNAVPQLHGLNAGLWYKLEVMGRVWAWERGDVLVLSGPVYADDAPPIGPGRRLPLPSAFWKVFTDPETREELAFLVPHDEALGWSRDPAAYAVSVEAVEEASGLRLPRPPGWALRPPSFAPWPADLRRADDIRGAACPGR